MGASCKESDACGLPADLSLGCKRWSITSMAKPNA